MICTVKSLGKPKYNYIKSTITNGESDTEKKYIVRPMTSNLYQKTCSIHMPTIATKAKYSMNGAAFLATSTASLFSIATLEITNGYNSQTIKYVSTIMEQKHLLNQSNADFLENRYSSGEKLTSTFLRNKTDWSRVKSLVVRDELMKLQIGDKTDLPFSKDQISAIKNQIEGKDLSNLTDADINNLINSIIRQDKSVCLAAFRAYKENGIVSESFQISKIDELTEELSKIDLNKITQKELDHLINNYWEKLEIHHRESISSDPSKQNDIDNLDTLNTSQHDAKHTDHDTGKINYKRPLNEEMLDRAEELRRLNQERVIKNELKGLGITLAIAAGTGFAIGFITSLAQSGISPKCVEHAFITGAKTMGESSAIATVSYGIGRTVGSMLTKTISDIIVSKLTGKVSEEILSRFCTMCNMGIVGTLSIMVSAIYQFVKLKIAGYATKECLIRTGKNAIGGLAVLALSIIAQGVWGGYAGIIVSISLSVIITGYNVGMIIHDKNVAEKVKHYLVKLSYPQYCEMV